MCKNPQFLIHQETTALAAGSQLLSHQPEDRENCGNQSMLEPSWSLGFESIILIVVKPFAILNSRIVTLCYTQCPRIMFFA